jgi:DNA-binding NarL/FixJ family response regulator
MTKTTATKVLIVDDHPLLRRGIAALIAAEKDFTVCGEVSDARQVIGVIEKTHPDIVLLDIALNGSSGIEVLKNIRVQFPKLTVLILSMHDETIYAPRSLRAGASGYVMKQQAPEKVISAIRKTLNGQVALSAEMEGRLLNRFTGKQDATLTSPIDVLSDRELEVFDLLGQGSGTAAIAEKLHLSVKTIESHRAHIKEKLNLQSATELVRHAIQWVSSEAGAPERLLAGEPNPASAFRFSRS